MTDLIERLRARAKQHGGDKLLEEAAAALEAAREDGARLNWMDANGFTAYRAIDPIDGLSGHATVVHETQRPRRGCVADTIRAAIDQARGKAGQEVGNG